MSFVLTVCKIAHEAFTRLFTDIFSFVFLFCPDAGFISSLHFSCVFSDAERILHLVKMFGREKFLNVHFDTVLL